jgi:hypothetical protein
VKTWILTLDQEKALWLSNFMKMVRDAYQDDKSLRLSNDDAMNATDSIQQIGPAYAPEIKHLPNTNVGPITDADGYSDEFSG